MYIYEGNILILLKWPQKRLTVTLKKMIVACAWVTLSWSYSHRISLLITHKSVINLPSRKSFHTFTLLRSFFPVEIESSVSGFSDQWFSNQWSCSQDTPIFKPMQNALYLFLFFFISFWTYFKMKAPSVTPTFFFLFVRSSACLYLTSTASSDVHIFGLKCCTFLSEVYNRLV